VPNQHSKVLSPGRSEALRRTPEALDLLRAIGSVGWQEEDVLDSRDIPFILDMMQKAKQYGPGLIVNQKQLEWLQKVAVRLMEVGVLVMKPVKTKKAKATGKAASR
jgi:hypothetical protein